jgi:hypothetical protein
MSISSDDHILAAADELQGAIKVWDIRTGQLKYSIPSPFGVRALAISPNNQTLAVGVDGGNSPEEVSGKASHPKDHLKLIDLNTRRTLQSIPDQAGNTYGSDPLNNSIVFSPDGDLVARSGQKGVQLYKVLTGRPAISLSDRQSPAARNAQPLGFLSEGKILSVLQTAPLEPSPSIQIRPPGTPAEPAHIQFWDIKKGKLNAQRSLTLSNKESRRDIYVSRAIHATTSDGSEALLPVIKSRYKAE